MKRQKNGRFAAARIAGEGENIRNEGPQQIAEENFLNPSYKNPRIYNDRTQRPSSREYNEERVSSSGCVSIILLIILASTVTLICIIHHKVILQVVFKLFDISILCSNSNCMCHSPCECNHQKVQDV